MRCITYSLRRLASGDSQVSVGADFGISKSTISHEVLQKSFTLEKQINHIEDSILCCYFRHSISSAWTDEFNRVLDTKIMNHKSEIGNESGSTWTSQKSTALS